MLIFLFTVAMCKQGLVFLVAHLIAFHFQVWSLVGIDLIGPLQETKKGNKYIIALTDHFSKWSEACGIPNKSATTVAEFLFHICCRLGCFETLISDQGREFINDVVDNLMKRFQVEHRISSAYHPQTNGQRERDNFTLKSALMKLVNDEGDNWDDFIPAALFAYHTSMHASTKFTPFEIMFGRKARLPIDLKCNEDEEDNSFEKCYSETIAANHENCMQKIRCEMNQKVTQNIEAAKVRQKKDYDKRKSNKRTIEVGASVYIRNFRQVHRMGSKMEPRWIGPYSVIEALGKGRLKLKNKAGKTLKNTYHVANLKVFANGNKDRFVNENNESAKMQHDAEQLQKTEAYTETQAIKPPSGNETVETHCSDAAQSSTERTCVKLLSKKQRIGRASSLGLQIFILPDLPEDCNLNEPVKVKKIEGDGNCFFRALCYLLTGSQKEHLKLRNEIIMHMTDNCSVQLQNYLIQDVHHYIESSHMSDSSTWATDAEILGASSLLKCDILVYSKYGATMSWLRYPASFSISTLSQQCLLLQNFHSHFEPVLVVA